MFWVCWVKLSFDSSFTGFKTKRVGCVKIIIEQCVTVYTTKNLCNVNKNVQKCASLMHIWRL